MFFDFANVLIFVALAMALVFLMTGLSWLLRPHNPEPGKMSTYECGEPPTGGAWINFNIRFYLVALVFVIFDVEVAFIAPVTVVFRDWVERGAGLYAYTEIAIFLVILFLGLVYVWAKGDLEWVKRVASSDADDEDEDVREAA